MYVDMDISQLQKIISILLIVYVMRMCHAVCHTDLSSDKYVTCKCETLDDFNSIQNICKDYRCSLYLTHSNLLTLPSSSFLALPNIGALHLAGLAIQELNHGIFSGLSNITEIHLQENNITKIPRNVFDHLHTLKILDLSFNEIKTFIDGSFEHSTSIEYLDLSFNQITYIPSTVLDPLKNLNILNISNNGLSSRDLQNVCRVPLLKTLILDKNQIDNIDNCLKNTKITYLSISDNFLRSLRNSIFSSHVIELYLAGNYISEFETKTFENSVNLKTLDISRNQIKNLPPNSFENMINLELFNIAENHITGLQQNTFSNLFNLKTLNISYNYLSTIEYDTFSSLASLEILDLSNNHFVAFDVNFLNFSHMRILKFSENVLSCNEVAGIFYNANTIRKNIFLEVTNYKNSNRIVCLNESINNLNSPNHKQKPITRRKREDTSNDSFNKLKDTLQNLQSVLEKLTGTIVTLNEKLSGESQNYEKFFASVNNISTHFVPDDGNINFGGDLHINDNSNVSQEKQKIVSVDTTKLENLFQKFSDDFSSFLKKSEKKDKESYTQKQEATSDKSEPLQNKFSEIVDDFTKEAKQMVAILSQLRLIVIFFGLVLLLLYTVKTIKHMRNSGKQEYDGLSMEMPIITGGQSSRF